MSEKPLEDLRQFEAARVAQTIARRAKQLQQMKKRFHWSDGLPLPISLYYPRHLLGPAMSFAFGLTFLILAFVLALQRRVDALARLLESETLKGTESSPS